MKKIKDFLIIVVLTCSLFLNIMSCQKQQDATSPKQPTTAATTIAKINIDDQHDYTIPLDQAAIFTERYRNTIKDKPEEPIAYRVPLGAILQLLKRVNSNGIINDVSHITFYIGIDDEGNRKLIYAATKPDGSDILQYPHDENYDGPHKSPVYDEAGGCPTGNCIINSNILNNK